jgi:ABC-type nitrate/sulfonate/bicarbonate transport system substrate-binding protein
LETIHLSLLRGICQMPGYIADAKQFFRQQGLDVRLSIEPTAWVMPQRLLDGAIHFAVMPWTRVAAAHARGEPLVLVCGSGCEEAAIVIRPGLWAHQVRRVAVPQEGGIKDLTARGLIDDLGWNAVEWVRQPSGDGAILAFLGQGADAASMVEPYAAMLEGLGLGTVVRRTGDLWPGAPGCSLTTTVDFVRRRGDLVKRMVRAYAEGAQFVAAHPDEAAAIAARYIGLAARFIRAALDCCRPDVHALHHQQAMDAVLQFMCQMGYVQQPVTGFIDTTFLDDIWPAPASMVMGQGSGITLTPAPNP